MAPHDGTPCDSANRHTRRHQSRRSVMSALVSYVGKRVVVTGAASGVGAALVEVLEEAGAAHITTIDVNPGAAVGQNIDADLSDPNAVDRAIAEITGPVDVLFNNAGVAATFAIDVVMAVNVLAPKRSEERRVG